MLENIVSGGATGVDRAALDVACGLGIECGGWCPSGRLADDGRLANGYRARMPETPSRHHAQCTAWNVRDSDGTLIVNRGRVDGGVRATVHFALRRYHKPVLVLNLRTVDPTHVRRWLRRKKIRVLNVAGPREAKRRGVYRQARRLLTHVFSSL